ncbi:MAG: hypothetical protein ACM3MK_07870, partial [Chitinophagales bacterium]
MILNIEQLREKAHELALIHDPFFNRRPSWRLWREFKKDVSNIREFLDFLQEGHASCSQPAEEWLLDNAEFLEEQILVVRQLLSGVFLRDLPNLRRTGNKRILSICIDYLQHVDGYLDEDSLITYMKSYQQVSVLGIAEVWAIPLILRIALIKLLAEVTKEVRQRRETCILAERLLTRIDPSEWNQESLKAALSREGQEMPLSGSLIVHLVRHLREWADDSASVRELLMCELDNSTESLDRMISYEYQLQAAYQVTTGNLIESLRSVSRWDWNERFEQICMVEHTLREEKAGVYPLLDFSSRDVLRQQVERLANRLRVPENLIAEQAVRLSSSEYERVSSAPEGEKRVASDADELPRKAFAAYYLLEPSGMGELQKALKICGNSGSLPEISVLQRAPRSYLITLLGLLALVLIGFAGWIGRGTVNTTAGWTILALALLLPASEWAVAIAHWLIGFIRRPRPLLKYDFSSGVPPEATTMVVIPVIWSKVKEVQELTARLELHFLANRDPNIHFALLADFKDAPQETIEEDETVLAAARAGVEALNETYSGSSTSTFHLFHRSRSWNESEKAWMGWERKRGALVELVEILKGRPDINYHIVGDQSVLPGIRYVITLDADTQLPIGNARRLIGTLHLPYNRPRLNRSRTRVVEGYGVLQPCINISHMSALRSRFAFLWSADPGIDPYT